MALVAVFGPHAIGKTTALDKFARAECIHLPHVTVVLMDNNLELWWDGSALQEYRYHGRTHWKGDVEAKRSMVLPSIEATRELVIGESVRGINQPIVDGHELYGGGVHVVVLTCEPAMLRDCLVSRCESKGKKFNTEYWDDWQLKYESGRRYLNAAAKYFEPAGIPWTHFVIDRERKNWTEVLSHIQRLAAVPLDDWY